jgi:hypothetical protein
VPLNCRTTTGSVVVADAIQVRQPAVWGSTASGRAPREDCATGVPCRGVPAGSEAGNPGAPG